VPVFPNQGEADVENGRGERQERSEIFVLHTRIPLYRIPSDTSSGRISEMGAL
jgi:hypothetical protein